MYEPVNGTVLFLDVVGEGPPLLLMHGGLGFDHSYFRPWLDPLGSDLQLIYYDHRGNGRSDEPQDWSAVHHGTWAEDADALREVLGHERVLLFGHSYGGFLALEYARKYPARLSGLILCSTAPAADYMEQSVSIAAERGTAEQVEVLTTRLGAVLPDEATFRYAFRRLLPLYFHRYDEAVGTEMLRRMRMGVDAFNHAFLECLPSYDVSADLGRIEVPTLVLGGRHDWFPSLEAGPARVAAGIPDAELVVFEESGHFPFIEEQDRFVSVVRAWAAEFAGVGM